MNPHSSRLRNLLTQLLLLWKKEKKSFLKDPALSQAIETLICAKQTKTPIPKESVTQFEALAKIKKGHSFFKGALETAITLIIALSLAILIRQMWFELYEIPTGSMRPTFKEQDRVLVSKTAFGVNTPLSTSHLTFSEDRVKRGSIVVITGDKLNLPDTDTTYFGIFPAKKRYVKRLIGLPGEYLYFYGGDIYILTADGTTIERLCAIPELANKEYIPFISFEGKVEAGKGLRFSRNKEFFILHFDKAIGKVELSSMQKIKSQICSNGQWYNEFKDQDSIVKTRPQSLGDFWGIGNFAKARFLLADELSKEAVSAGYSYPHAIAYLELFHDPELPQGALTSQNSLPLVTTKTAYLPLLDTHIEALAKALSTARFVISQGKVHRYHYEDRESEAIPLLKSIPDGTYEFISGTAYEIGFCGHAKALDSTHPIYPSSIEELQFWYNGGIDMHPEMLKNSSQLIPSRFAYYQDGKMLSMGKEVFAKGDPLLEWFIIQEIGHQAKDPHYTAFLDRGSPLSNKLDRDFFKQFGLLIPNHQYLVLGDNHAMSVDGRFFGTIPEENIQGSPVFILFPFGSRWGFIDQPNKFYYTPWNLAFLSLTVGSIWAWKRRARKKQEQLIDEFLTTNKGQ